MTRHRPQTTTRSEDVESTSSETSLVVRPITEDSDDVTGSAGSGGGDGPDPAFAGDGLDPAFAGDETIPEATVVGVEPDILPQYLDEEYEPETEEEYERAMEQMMRHQLEARERNLALRDQYLRLQETRLLIQQQQQQQQAQHQFQQQDQLHAAQQQDVYQPLQLQALGGAHVLGPPQPGTDTYSGGLSPESSDAHAAGLHAPPHELVPQQLESDPDHLWAHARPLSPEVTLPERAAGPSVTPQEDAVAPAPPDVGLAPPTSTSMPPASPHRIEASEGLAAPQPIAEGAGPSPPTPRPQLEVEEIPTDSSFRGSTGSRSAAARPPSNRQTPRQCVPPAASRVLTSLPCGTRLPRDGVVECVVERLLVGVRGDEGGGGRSAAGSSCSGSGSGEFATDPSMDAASNSRGLFDPADFNVVLTGMGGTGKTAVAAMVASRDDVLSHFSDGIAWLELGQKEMTRWGVRAHRTQLCSSYECYCAQLRAICKQLCLEPPAFDEAVILPGDNDQTVEERMQMLMNNARQDMMNLLSSAAVLIIIDDLWHAPDVKWFCFSQARTSAVRLFITTRLQIHTRQNESVCSLRENVIHLTALEEHEAVKLLLNEARISSRNGARAEVEVTSTADQQEALKIVRACHCLPVAVRSAGRLLFTLSPSRVGLMGMDELASQLAASEEQDFVVDHCFKDDASVSVQYEALFEILDRSFSSKLHGPSLAKALKVCFTAFAVVFTRADCARPFVPINAIELLWDGILTNEERQTIMHEPGQTVTARLLEMLERLGLVDSRLLRHQIRQDRRASLNQVDILNYRIHHDCMLHLALSYFKSGDVLKSSEMNRRFHQNKVNVRSQHALHNTNGSLRKKVKSLIFQKNSRSNPVDDHRLRQLNMLLTQKYIQKGENGISCSWDSLAVDDGYVFEHLPDHMIKVGGRKMFKRTLLLLREEGFIWGRMMSMGFEEGIKAHESNVKSMTKWDACRRGGGNRESSTKGEILLICESLRCFLENEHLKETSATSSDSCLGLLDDIGHGYAAIGAFLQRQGLWIEALDFFAEALDVYRSAGIGDDHPDAVRALLHVQASTLPKLVIVPCDSPARIILKHASRLRRNALDGENDNPDSLPAHSSLAEHSGIPLELCSHPGLAVVYLGNRLKSFGFECTWLGIGPVEGALHACLKEKVLSSPSDGAFIASLSSTSYHTGDHIVMVPPYMKRHKRWGRIFRFDLELTDEGAISPVGKPDLALGLGCPSLMLVSRDSPNRIILKYGTDLREKRLPEVGHDPHEGECFPLELSSHPGHAVVAESDSPFDYGYMRIAPLGIGPVEDAIRVSYDGRLIASSKDGAVLQVAVNVNKVGTHVNLVRGKKKAFTRYRGGGNDFVINEEGSISPMHAPNLALGCAFLGRANNIITEESRQLARGEAKLKPTQSAALTAYRNAKSICQLAISFRLDKSRADHM